MIINAGREPNDPAEANSSAKPKGANVPAQQTLNNNENE
jgi:hypothetical protein